MSPSRDRIECGERLVEQQEGRPLREAHRHRDLGLLTDREVADLLVAPYSELAEIAVGGDCVPVRIESFTEAQHLPKHERRGRGDVPGRGIRSPKHLHGLALGRAAEHADLTGTWPCDPRRHTQEGRLSGPVRPNKRRDPSGGQAD